MKILTIQAAYYPMIGGAEVFHQRTAEWMVKQGHQVDVATCVWDKPDVAWKNWQKGYEVINGVNIYRVRPWFYAQYLKSFGSIWPLYNRALQLIKVNKYELIHAHISPASIIGALLKRKTGLPLIITVQGGDLADYLETGSSFNWLLEPIIKWALKKSDTVHTVSTYMKHIVKSMGAKSIKVVPNGVDTKLFRQRGKKVLRKKYKIDLDKYIIISHSRLTPKNGLDILIKAVDRLPNKEKVVLLLIGGGEQDNELKELAKKLDLGNLVKFYGYQDRETTAELLALSDVFVRPSRQEGFGIAFLEAMACGLAVVGAKVGGIPEIITDGSDGVLVNKEDIISLRDTLQKLQDDEGLRTKLGIQGRKKAEKDYSWTKISNDLEEIYKRVSL